VSIEQWLVGDAFLKNVYSVFDFSSATTRIGFAQLGTNGSSNVPPGTGTSTPENAGASSWTIPSTTVMALQALSVVCVLFVTL